MHGPPRPGRREHAPAPTTLWFRAGGRTYYREPGSDRVAVHLAPDPSGIAVTGHPVKGDVLDAPDGRWRVVASYFLPRRRRGEIRVEK